VFRDEPIQANKNTSYKHALPLSSAVLQVAKKRTSKALIINRPKSMACHGRSKERFTFLKTVNRVEKSSFVSTGTATGITSNVVSATKKRSQELGSCQFPNFSQQIDLKRHFDPFLAKQELIVKETELRKSQELLQARLEH